ncbi:MAG TPA: DUF6502 family protein [Candidatus Binatia bacterium]|nr:DUF6502 family protein [Candidatus Binatia bacterium]
MVDIRDGLVGALIEMVRPLVKRLLALGVPFGRVESRLRELFVEIAEAELALPGRRQTDSRIALVTGINRKEVRRIRSADRHTGAPRSFSMNQAVSLISRWRTDPQTSDRSGRPRPLPYQAVRGASFMKLARKVTGDLAPRILLDELVRSGAAEIRPGDVVVLKGDAYVPKAEPAEKLEILAEDPAELVETILRNILAEESDRLFQRKVYFDNLGSDAAERIRAEMRREGERFLRRVDRLLARYDRDRNPKAPGGERHYAGLGVYFFDEKPAADRGSGVPRSAKRRERARSVTDEVDS